MITTNPIYIVGDDLKTSQKYMPISFKKSLFHFSFDPLLFKHQKLTQKTYFVQVLFKVGDQTTFWLEKRYSGLDTWCWVVKEKNNGEEIVHLLYTVEQYGIYKKDRAEMNQTIIDFFKKKQVDANFEESDVDLGFGFEVMSVFATSRYYLDKEKSSFVDHVMFFDQNKPKWFCLLSTPDGDHDGQRCHNKATTILKTTGIKIGLDGQFDGQETDSSMMYPFISDKPLLFDDDHKMQAENWMEVSLTSHFPLNRLYDKVFNISHPELKRSFSYCYDSKIGLPKLKEKIEQVVLFCVKQGDKKKGKIKEIVCKKLTNTFFCRLHLDDDDDNIVRIPLDYPESKLPFYIECKMEKIKPKRNEEVKKKGTPKSKSKNKNKKRRKK